MWLLMIVFLTLPSHNTVLDQFETLEACQKERDRVGFDMADSYPNDHDFDLICLFRARVI